MIDLQKLATTDPLKRMVEKDSGLETYSPMDPPNAFSPPTLDTIPYNDLHPCLQTFMDEHRLLEKELEEFEKSLLEFKKGGWKMSKESEKKFSTFFSFMDEKMTKHHLKEEKVLFPLLQKRLIENNKHSQARFPKTSIDMLEDDHIKIMQHLTLLFNFIALAVRLPDPPSRALTFDVASEQGLALIELLRLHLFREENVVFPQANMYISNEEFEIMLKRVEDYAHY